MTEPAAQPTALSAAAPAPLASGGGHPPEDLATRIAEVVQRCPDVAALSGGLVGEIASYLPGKRVHGVRVREDSVEVHVVGIYGPPLDVIAEQVRTAVLSLALGRRVDVGIDDLMTVEELAEQRAAEQRAEERRAAEQAALGRTGTPAGAPPTAGPDGGLVPDDPPRR
jgi:hypothetical protein